jgi:hypothetical protein
MNTYSKTLLLGLFLVLNACGASAVGTSSRFERGGGGGGPSGMGRAPEANVPANVEQPMFDRQDANRDSYNPRDNARINMDQDCWRCR